MKRVVIFESIILAILLFLFFAYTPLSKTKTKTVTINSHKLKIEVADNDTLRTQGLSNRDRLEKDKGMLFIFDRPGYYQFWMKEMKFPLDFVWINDKKVVDLTENVSPATSTSDLKTFTAKYPFDKVLEVNAGVVKSLKIIVGDDAIIN